MKVLMIVSVIAVLLTGCVSNQLISLEEEGILTKHPIRIMDSTNLGKFTFRGQISRSDRESARFSNDHSENDSTSFSHFSFKIPKYQFNGEAEIGLNDHLGFIAGLSLGKVGDQEYIGTHLGAALYSVYENNSIRFDIGAKHQKLSYKLTYGTYVTHFMSNEELLKIVEVNSKGEFTNLYLGYTVNRNNDGVFANIFFSYLFSYQTYFDYRGDANTSGFKFNDSMHTVTLGLFKNISGFGRVLIGARKTLMSFEFGQTAPFDLFLQYDFSL
jgi:hypothetical protein